MEKRKTLANLPVLPGKNEHRRFTLLSILFILVVQFSFISWNTQKMEEESIKYLNENIIGQWCNNDKVFNHFTFEPDGTVETISFELSYEKTSDNNYLIYTDNKVPAYDIEYLDWKTIKITSKLGKKNKSSIYTREIK